MKLLRSTLVNIFVFISSLFITYGLFELLFYLLILNGIFPSPFGIETYISKQSAIFDPIFGYKWSGMNNRIIRLKGTQVIFDNEFTPNNIGRISHRDYSYQKAENIYRIIVLGDSFTETVYLDTTWLYNFEKYINEFSADSVEIYSFAIDGGGIKNWHNIFFKELLPFYDFDCLLINIWKDNLYRDFSIFHMTDKYAYFNRFSTIPKDSDEFIQSYLPKMNKLYKIRSDSYIENRINNLEFDFYFYYTIYDRLTNLFRRILNQSIADNESIKKKYQSSLLINIIDSCKSNDIPVVLSSVPSVDGLKQYLDKNEIEKYSYEVLKMSEKLNLKYFNGYKIFSGMDYNDVKDKYWFKYDGHWNSNGAGLFAKKLSEYFIKNQLINN